MQPVSTKVTPIKNAYINIEAACKKRISKLYPAGIPSFAEERLELELSYAKKKQEFSDDLEICSIFCASIKSFM